MSFDHKILIDTTPCIPPPPYEDPPYEEVIKAPSAQPPLEPFKYDRLVYSNKKARGIPSAPPLDSFIETNNNLNPTTINKYRIRCLTCHKRNYIWSEELPLVCPINRSHAIDHNETLIVN